MAMARWQHGKTRVNAAVGRVICGHPPRLLDLLLARKKKGANSTGRREITVGVVAIAWMIIPRLRKSGRFRFEEEN